MSSLDHIWSRLGRRASQRLRTGDAPAAELPESTTTNVLHEEAPRPPQRSAVDDMNPYLPGRMATTKPTSTAPNPNAFDPAAFRPSAPAAPSAPAPSARQRAAQMLPWLADRVVAPWIPPPTDEDADPDLYQAEKVRRAPRTSPKASASPATPAPFQTALEPPRGPWIPPPTEEQPESFTDRLAAFFRDH